MPFLQHFYVFAKIVRLFWAPFSHDRVVNILGMSEMICNLFLFRFLGKLVMIPIKISTVNLSTNPTFRGRILDTLLCEDE